MKKILLPFMFFVAPQTKSLSFIGGAVVYNPKNESEKQEFNERNINVKPGVVLSFFDRIWFMADITQLGFKQEKWKSPKTTAKKKALINNKNTNKKFL